MRALFLRAVLLSGFAVTGVTLAPQARADGFVAHGDDGHVGMSWGLSRREAERRALRECGEGCSIVGHFERECAAVAVGRNGAYGWASRRQQGAAEEGALDECRAHDGRECRVRVAGCDR